MMEKLKYIKLILSMMLLLLASDIYGQTVSGNCSGGKCNSFSSFSNCGGGVYKATMVQGTWDVARFKVYVNGSYVYNLGYNAANNCNYDAYYPPNIQTASNGGTNKTWYVKVTTGTKRVDLTTSNFTCSSASKPTITTTNISSVTCNSASSGGTSINQNGASITAKGVCWSTSQNPTTANSKTSNGTGTSNFTSSITGLSPNTTYYVRAYATNSAGTGYGTQKSFTTSAAPGTPGTSTAINPTCNGFTARWGTSSNSPTGYYLYVSTASNFSSHISGFNGKNVGNVTQYNITGLTPGVTYYYRVRAHKSGCSTSGYSGTMNKTTTGLPTVGTVTGASRCGTGTLQIKADVSAGTVRWWTAASGGSQVGTSGDNALWTTPSISSTTTYYAEAINGSCVSSSRKAVTATITATPTVGTVTGASRCGTGTLQIKADVSAGTVRWWTAASGGSQVGTSGDNALWTTPSISSTTTYYAEAINGSCVSSSRKAVTATVTPPPTAGTLSGTQAICVSGSTTFSSTVSGGTWSSNNTGIATINSSTGVISGVSAGTATMTYTKTGSGGCSNATATRTVTVSAAPTAGTLSGTQAICVSGSTTFSSTVSGGTWSSSNTGIATINSSTGVISGVSAGTATMTYTKTGSGGCSNATATRTVTVSAAPTAGTLSGTQAICVSGSTTFSSTVSGGTWSSSNTGIATINSSTGVISGVSAGTATMTYTKTGAGGCSNATATRTVTVSAPPTVGTVTGASRCGTGTLQIKADVSAGTVRWWTASSGGSQVGTSGDNALWTTPSISSTTTYYAEAINGSCVSASRTAVTATVNVNPTVTVSTQSKCGNVGDMIFTFPDESSRTNIEFSINNGSTYIYNTADNVGSYTASSLAPGNYEVWTRWGNDECPVDLGTITITGNVTPSITSSSSGSRCNSGTVDISATSSAGSIDWYTSSTGGSSIGSSNSGVNWTTPSISSTTTYYAEGVNGSCISSSRTAVTANVNTASVGPGGVTDELMVWLKADDANLGSTWQDHSCNGYDYTKVTGPTLVNNGWNHNPSIEILSGGFDAPAGAELGTEWTVFFVSALKSSGKHGRLIEGHTGNYLLGYHGGYRNSIYWNGGTAAEHNSGIATQIDVESPHIFMYKRENTGGNIITKIDGDYKKTFTSTNSGSGIRLDINQGSYKNSESTHSRIGEFIIYNKTLSDVEVRKVEAYLATKYGIVLSYDDGGTGGDYISTGGTTYWDASARSGYTNDVVVIGKDNSTALTQKQAKSKDDSLQVFISSLASNNASNNGSISNNESFIAIGHNGGKLKTSESANTEKPAGIYSRFEREWCLTNTNFTDDFSLKVEWDSAGTFDINDIRLLVDDDGDFSNASVYGPADGLTFSIGSIVVGGASSSMFPSGDTKYFTLASSSESTPLPIELLYFTANEEEGYIILNWETAMEINNDYFIVEKSTDGNNWEQITTVPGAGISTSPITYVYVDRDICENTCYYRLTQVDYDGTSKTFKTIHVNADIYNDVINMEVVPNPVSSKANVSVNAYEDGISYFKVLNIQGDLIYTATVPIYKGVNYFDINMSIYESGTYYFNIQMESGQTKTVPVVKK